MELSPSLINAVSLCSFSWFSLIRCSSIKIRHPFSTGKMAEEEECAEKSSCDIRESLDNRGRVVSTDDGNRDGAMGMGSADTVATSSADGGVPLGDGGGAS